MAKAELKERALEWFVPSRRPDRQSNHTYRIAQLSWVMPTNWSLSPQPARKMAAISEEHILCSSDMVAIIETLLMTIVWSCKMYYAEVTVVVIFAVIAVIDSY